jgi:hypothetical protein
MRISRAWRCVRPDVLTAVLSFWLLLIAASAAAGDINISGGSLDAQGISGSGPIVLQGDRGFTFSGRTFLGNYQPGLGPFEAGARASLLALWVGSDLRGVATLDGVTYPSVGSPTDTSATAASLQVEFHGTFVLPTDMTVKMLVVPFVLKGELFRQGGSELLHGSGLATIDLSPVPFFPRLVWQVNGISYQLGGALAAPWLSHDIGAVGLTGSSSTIDDTLILAGDGSDIWGSADSFRYTFQQVPAPAGITARVVSQQQVYPSAQQPAGALSAFAKAGVMIRASADANAATVVLDLKPDGGLEFMARYATGEPMTFIAGGVARAADVWLSLEQIGGEIAGAYSLDGATWTAVGSVSVTMPANTHAGLAVTSHNPAVLNGVIFDHVAVRTAMSPNILTRGDFEDYDPPALGPPGWLSDDLLRQVPAKSETHQPRSGVKNGACWTPAFLDCGIYQEVSAPATGTYTFEIYASADRAGGLVGVNVNGAAAASDSVAVRPFGDYALHTMTFSAQAGDAIRVWMYSPATPGYVVIDDAALWH